MSQWGKLLLKEVEGTVVAGNTIALWSLGGAGIFLKTPASTILIDPYFGTSTSEDWIRMIAVPLDPKDITTCDLFISTHEHEDHCERSTAIAISERTEAKFIGPESSCKRFLSWGIKSNRVVALKPGESFSFKDVTVTAWFANDPDAESAISYVIQSGDIKIFHAGDSKFSESFSKVGASGGVDIAILSLGRNPSGHKYYMNACDVVEAARDLGAHMLIPVHWDIWRRTREDPELVRCIVQCWGLPLKVVILRLGDSYVYKRP